MVPFILAAGATQYPVKKFLLALGLGRMVRYSVLGFLAARYGRHILSFFSRFGHPSALTLPITLEKPFSIVVRTYPTRARIGRAGPISVMPPIMALYRIPIAIHPDKIRAGARRPIIGIGRNRRVRSAVSSNIDTN